MSPDPSSPPAGVAGRDAPRLLAPHCGQLLLRRSHPLLLLAGRHLGLLLPLGGLGLSSLGLCLGVAEGGAELLLPTGKRVAGVDQGLGAALRGRSLLFQGLERALGLRRAQRARQARALELRRPGPWRDHAGERAGSAGPGQGWRGGGGAQHRAANAPPERRPPPPPPPRLGAWPPRRALARQGIGTVRRARRTPGGTARARRAPTAASRAPSQTESTAPL